MPIKRLSSGGIIANYQCPAACGHCLYGCSPAAQPGYIDEPMAAKLCGQLRRLGCQGLHIGGGEPFLNIKGLIGLIKAIRGSGISLEYIETNAAWITGDERYLPLLGRLDPGKTYDGQALKEVFGYDVQWQCAQEYGMRFGGRALNLLRKYGERKPITPPSKPCSELQNTGHFHVDYLGRYIPPGCTGMGILLEDLGNELDPASYPVLSRLYKQGLGGLLEHAQELGYVLNPGGYVSKCELCFDIRKYLVSADRRGHPDLTPERFYMQDF